MSRFTRAGREHIQAANSSWSVEIFHTIDVMLSLGMGVGWGQESWLSCFCQFESSFVQDFELFFGI